MPTVSVVIPTYNHADYVLETLESVFAQTFTDHEIIVVNDGSPDATAERLHPLAETGRIRYFEQPNAGQSSARNRGLAEASGTFIAFLDDDDVWPPDKLAWQVSVLGGDETAGVVYGQKLEMGGDGVPHPGECAPEGDVFTEFVSQGWIQSPGQVLIRRDVLERAGGFDPEIWGTDDWDLWLRLAKEARFSYRPKPALIYRRHATNASKNFVRMWENGHAVIRKNLRDAPGSDLSTSRKAAQKFVNDFAADDGLVYAYQLMSAGRLSAAATALCQIARIRGWKRPDRASLTACFQLGKQGLRRVFVSA